MKSGENTLTPFEKWWNEHGDCNSIPLQERAFNGGQDSLRESLRIALRALEKIDAAKDYTRLADCCVEKTCHINTESGSCSFQTGVHYGNCDRAAEASEALAQIRKRGHYGEER